MAPTTPSSPTTSSPAPSGAAAAVTVGPRGGIGAALGLSEPVRVEVPAATPASADSLVSLPVHAPLAEVKTRLTRVAVVVPCFNRRSDAEALLGDLAGMETRGLDIRVLLVDNASAQPLSALATPPGLALEHLRLSTNTGGSGGYNAGMSRVLNLSKEDATTSAWGGFDPEFVWLVDSDARVAPDTLRTLLEVLEQDRGIVAAGSAVADPITGQFFELGGHVNRRNGNYEPHVIGNAGVHRLVECDYVAACCALVRADAIRCAGLFPDTFLNGDDIEWFIRMGRITGGRIVGVPWSHAMHPRYDRFPTWTRYYMTRNAFGPLDSLGVSRRTRLVRAMKEVPRAVQQDMMGRHDLSRLHLLGLKHAGQMTGGRRSGNRGIAGAGVVAVEPNIALRDLSAALIALFGQPSTGDRRVAVVHPDLLISDSDRALIERELRAAGFEPRPRRKHAAGGGFVRSCMGAFRRWALGAEAPVAVVPARGRPDAWFLGRRLIEVVPGGCVIRQATRMGTPLRAARTLLVGAQRARAVAARPGEPPSLLNPRYAAERAAAESTLSVEAVVLSYNRWPALERTLTALQNGRVFGGARAADAPARTITVVDNASTDGTPARVENSFPGVRLMKMDKNLGVEAFNEAVMRSTADAVLILDDDAIPDDDALAVAVRALETTPGLGAVTLHPRHPRDGRSEWPFAAGLHGSHTDACPVMGCANLVRRCAWNTVGGYEKEFFLYRNDADLALKLLGSGLGVRFDPALVVHHDTPAGAGSRKSVRWHELATRNWIWMARRHGRGVARLSGALMGWAWAHRHAGLSPARHLATLRGAWAGWLGTPPALRDIEPDGTHWARLLRLQLRSRL